MEKYEKITQSILKIEIKSVVKKIIKKKKNQETPLPTPPIAKGRLLF